MELTEEYWNRKKVKAPLVKLTDKATLTLKSKGNSEWAWLHVNVSSFSDGQHPVKYNFVVSANPQLYATPDMMHFAHQSKVVEEQQWEWEQYEPGLVDWAKKHAPNYLAITSQDAAFVAWEVFVTNYDSWIAYFLPYRLQDMIFVSVSEKEAHDVRQKAIKDVEDYLREKFEKVFLCWKNLKGAIEQKHYADWLAKIVNDLAPKNETTSSGTKCSV